MSRILYLKNLGFSLEEIKNYDNKLKEMEETYLERSSHLMKSNESLKTMTKKRRKK